MFPFSNFSYSLDSGILDNCTAGISVTGNSLCTIIIQNSVYAVMIQKCITLCVFVNIELAIKYIFRSIYWCTLVDLLHLHQVQSNGNI